MHFFFHEKNSNCYHKLKKKSSIFNKLLNFFCVQKLYYFLQKLIDVLFLWKKSEGFAFNNSISEIVLFLFEKQKIENQQNNNSLTYHFWNSQPICESEFVIPHTFHAIRRVTCPHPRCMTVLEATVKYRISKHK